MKAMIKKCALIDTWRNLNPGKNFIRKRKNPFIAGRLDYIFRNEMINKISMCKINPFYRSDHCAVDIIFYNRKSKGVLENER